MVLLIALLHSLPLLLTLKVSGKKSAIWTVGILSALFAVLTGSSRYDGTDLFVVVVTFLFCLYRVRRKPNGVGPHANPIVASASTVSPVRVVNDQQVPKKQAGPIHHIVLIILLLPVALIFVAMVVSPVQPNITQPAVQRAVTNPAKTPMSNAPVQPSTKKVAKSVNKNSSIESCLRLVSDDAMTKCLERKN